MANEMGVRFLGSIPIDPQIVEACDDGRPYVDHYADSESAKAFEKIVTPILEIEKEQETSAEEKQQTNEGEKKMRIAIPLAGGKLAMHFGHCEQFALIDVNSENKEIINKEFVEPPGYQPGVLPKWLSEQGANVIIASGMGSRAQNLFAESGIKVVVGAGSAEPESIVKEYLDGTLEAGDNICDH